MRPSSNSVATTTTSLVFLIGISSSLSQSFSFGTLLGGGSDSSVSFPTDRFDQIFSKKVVPGVQSSRIDTTATNTKSRGVSNRRSFEANPVAENLANLPVDTENLVGKSPCPRGKRGNACRESLVVKSSKCTSARCLRCHDCDNISAKDWPGCCREHFRCCRNLGQACRKCDKPELFPFCSAAFKKC